MSLRYSGTPLRRALLTVLLAGAFPPRGLAQSMVLASRDETRRVGNGPRTPEAVTAPAVVVSGPPRSFQVVTVTVPDGISARRPVRYEVIQTGLVPLMGKLKGTVATDSGSGRRVLVTLPVPASSRSGVLPVARVRFFVDGGLPVDVPLQVAILPQQRLELTALEALRAVRPGEGFTLTFRVTNLGNAPDTVEVRATGANGWRIAAQGSMVGIPLEVHGIATRTLAVTVPLGSSTGSEAIRLVALSHGQPLATTEVPVRILENGIAGIAGGPRAMLAAGVATGAWGTPSTAYSLTLDGEVTSGLRVSGRATMVTNPTGDGLYGLSRAGLYRMAPALQLTAARWGLGLGVTSARLTDQTGPNVGGQGAALDLRLRGLSASGYFARPQSGDARVPGALAGGRLDVQVGTATITGSASHLLEERLDRRRLDAVALGASMTGVFAGSLSTEVARRRFDAGSGLGWSGAYERRAGGSQLALRFGHFPGGNAAFARATDELQLTAGQRLSKRHSLAGSFYRNGDGSRSGLTSLVTSGWSIGTQSQLSEALSAGLTARRSHFSADGSFGGFGSSETALGASLGARRGNLYGTLDGSLASVARLTTSATGTRLNEAGTRLSSRAAVGAGGNFGVLEFSAAYDQGGASAGYLARQAELGVRVDHFGLLALKPLRLLGSGSVVQRSWFGERAALTSITAGLTAEFPSGFAASASAERNPFILTSRGVGGWFLALKAERALTLPRLAHESTRGMVYQDRNGNGSRDPGETGLGGVLIRSGMRSTVTLRDGSFRFEGRVADSVMIDSESLPLGLIVGKSSAPGRRPELAVVAVASVEVVLTFAPEALRRLSAAELSKVGVLAVDEKGRTWVARTGEQGLNVFDALPPGSYRVELDLSGLSEPFSAAGPLPEFKVGASNRNSRLEIPLRARPVKVMRLNQGGNNR